MPHIGEINHQWIPSCTDFEMHLDFFAKTMLNQKLEMSFINLSYPHILPSTKSI